MEENISFARKYRPTSLKGYIGNEDVKDTLRRYLKNGRPQSILLTGDSGCGKTTLARIIIKEYFCEDWDPEEGSCGECPTCEALNNYIRTGVSELPDIYEIDSSDKSGKKDIDSLLSNISYPPMAGDWKAYIIDEVHLLSEGAMGRLLKTLEEPPEGVLLIFCTTNPEKLLDTIKNRCQLKPRITKPTTKDIVDLLQRVCLEEGKDYDLSGLRMLASRSGNVVRDSLNNLERVLNTRGNATAYSVSLEFKEVSDKIIFDFYKAYYEKDYLSYINILYKIKTTYDFSQFLTSLTAFTTRGIYIMNSVPVEGLSEDEIKSYMSLFRNFSCKQISFILSSLRRMNLGDIESNFMAFIYSDIDLQEGKVDEETNREIQVKDVPISEEKLSRESNLKKLEESKITAGSKSVESNLQQVGFSDICSMFNLEKVK